MYKKISNLIIASLTFVLLVLPLQHIYAQETTTSTVAVSEIIEALEFELTAYESYLDYVDRLDSYTDLEIVSEYETRSQQWRRSFTTAKTTYEKYIKHPAIDHELKLIASTALMGSNTALQAIEVHDSFFSGSLNQDSMTSAAESGGELMTEAVVKHDEAVNLYNDYTGISSTLETLWWFYIFTFLSFLASVVLFFQVTNNFHL